MIYARAGSVAPRRRTSSSRRRVRVRARVRATQFCILRDRPHVGAAALLAAGYLFYPGFIAEILVKERECKLRNLLTVMGVDARAYWLGHFSADMLVWLFPAIGTWITINVLHLDAWTNNKVGWQYGFGATSSPAHQLTSSPNHLTTPSHAGHHLLHYATFRF